MILAYQTPTPGEIHRLDPGEDTLRGSYCAEDRPAAVISPGDRIIFRTLDCSWYLQKQFVAATDGGIRSPLRELDENAGHAMIGPIYINGAAIGDMLAIHIRDYTVGNWGWSRVGRLDNEHTRRLGLNPAEEYYLLWDLDGARGLGVSNQGHRVRLKPFLGLMGVAPKGAGRYPTNPPGSFGGNLDCCELVKGSTLFLPVYHEGGLFYAGDGHGLQGDGEMGGTSIECPFEQVDLQIGLIKGGYNYPIANTPHGIVTFGFGVDLTEAAYEAEIHLAEWMSAELGMTYQEAISMASLLADMRVTQIVNGVRGVHCILSDDAIQQILRG